MLSLCLAALAAGAPEPATLHLIQIEQLTAGTAGDPAAQAIQLRLRADHFSPLDGLRLVAYDAAGANPVTVKEFTSDPAFTAEGARVLVASDAFVRAAVPGAVADDLLDEPIPAAYLDAGSLTLEGGFGVWWRVSWGGDAYTGSTAGLGANDDDSDFGAPLPGALSSESGAWRLDLPFTERSTENADDYRRAEGPAVLVNNAGQGFGVPTALGTPLCFGASCPCDNADPYAGCASSVGAGGFLFASAGTTSVAGDDLVLLARDLPAANQGLFYMGDAAAEAPLFDGLQCAGGDTWRFLCCVQSTGTAGTLELGPGIASSAGGLITAGGTWVFQAWHRDVPGSPCGTGANLTSAFEVTFAP